MFLKMQYTKLFSALFIGVLVGIEACNALSYRLSADPATNLNTFHNEVSWVNSAEGGAYIGNVKFQQFAEPMIVSLSPDGLISFLTYHSERYQQWYIFKDDVKPVGLTTWQSIPSDATTTGFTVGDDGYLRYAGEDNWAVCPSATYTSSYQIFYVGGGNLIPADCVATKLAAQEYGVCTSNN